MKSDDPSIPDEEDLYRLIYSEWWLPTGDGERRISSAAFSDRGHEISIELASVATPEETLARGNDGSIGVASVTAGQARELKQAVVRDPLPGNDAHGLICGKQSKRVRQKMAKMATWALQRGDAG